MKSCAKWLMARMKSMEGDTMGLITNVKELKEIAATSAGLKAICTLIASDGIEEVRKCCGGNGYLLNSGLA